MRVLAILFKEPVNDIENLAEVFTRYSDQIAIRGKEAIFLGLSRSEKFPSEESVFLRVRAHLKCWDLNAQFSIAQDAPTALAMARFGVQRKGQLPLLSFYDYAMPFGITDEGAQGISRLVMQLERFRIRNVGDFLAMPEDFLIQNIGREILRIYDAVKDARNIPWPRLYPEEKCLPHASLIARLVDKLSFERGGSTWSGDYFKQAVE